MDAIAHLQLVARFRKLGIVPPFPLFVSMSWRLNTGTVFSYYKDTDIMTVAHLLWLRHLPQYNAHISFLRIPTKEGHAVA
jgi:hypothetical protein